ncbi:MULTISPECIES: geranylgeranylglycerol-phosphate geranylgeranyltransferase [Salegentibacter]|jgi:4-hydroxybenzoate polyprenyltransferase|uniref:4-hydroxybenzoate polyprenyltransferase n=1 Tax=Salegentibacter agarivorans TaxID=345907 RepID=A0A1I2MPL2_9FLAO|nr:MULTISPECIES: geranylgeranylglycerol-phosphate geranylgeranyltransferase [Salegentibacter]APS38463.1 ubiquinone biosynthesis protein UbiA [Salegentibacter sp. T436]SFF93383.1 4-hydroxybenzoate polyprenyltransferase [Salegentibacter agarivorans]|tara:strand:- start:531 stop:1436 length:906 start_codon:yes stop_codon:yes gene_type:complete
MASSSNKRLLLKMLSLFSVVRGYNILVLIVAQYLTSAFILAPELPLREILFDDNLFFLILSSATVIASGYIINNFYDSEKDLINRPKKTMLDRFVSQRTKLSGYFILNLLAIFFASYVSFRAVVFFSIYIFAIWLYSHRLKRILFLGNLVASILTITPFFVVFVYYKNFETVIFIHATFLYLMIVMRELVKDLENMKGDLIQNYQTIPVVYGERLSKLFLSVLCVLAIVPILLLITRYDTGYMNYYFYVSLLLLVFFLLFLYFSKAKWQYLLLHNILKLIIVVGVFSILLIDIQEVLNRVF